MEQQQTNFAKAGEYIRNVREKQGLTASQLCDQIKKCTGRTINDQALMRIERGTEPKVSVLFDICATLWPGDANTLKAVAYLTSLSVSNSDEVLKLGNTRLQVEAEAATAEAKAVSKQSESTQADYAAIKTSTASLVFPDWSSLMPEFDFSEASEAAIKLLKQNPEFVAGINKVSEAVKEYYKNQPAEFRPRAHEEDA